MRAPLCLMGAARSAVVVVPRLREGDGTVDNDANCSPQTELSFLLLVGEEQLKRGALLLVPEGFVAVHDGRGGRGSVDDAWSKDWLTNSSGSPR